MQSVLPVREADGGEAPEDARQFHAYTVERLEGHPAVPVSIRILQCITRYSKPTSQINVAQNS